MAISQAMCTSFKQEILVATHNFTITTGDVFKIALYTSTATLSAATTLTPLRTKWWAQVTRYWEYAYQCHADYIWYDSVFRFW